MWFNRPRVRPRLTRSPILNEVEGKSSPSSRTLRAHYGACFPLRFPPADLPVRSASEGGNPPTSALGGTNPALPLLNQRFLANALLGGTIFPMRTPAVDRIDLDELTKDIVTHYQPEKIILFGSRARGASDEYSDLDLILIKKTDQSFVERLTDPALLNLLPIRTDCFVYTPEEFERMEENENPFVMSALENAKVLYEKR